MGHAGTWFLTFLGRRRSVDVELSSPSLPWAALAVVAVGLRAYHTTGNQVGG